MLLLLLLLLLLMMMIIIIIMLKIEVTVVHVCQTHTTHILLSDRL